MYKETFPIGNFFSNCAAIGSTQIAFPIIVLPKDDHAHFVQEERHGSSILDHDLGHLCRSRRIQMSGHFAFEIFNNLGAFSIFNWVQADTASAACPTQPGSLEMISMTFAAVICDADDPCSVNTACASFTMSPRSTTRPLFFWCFASNSVFFSYDICPGKMNFCARRLCFIDHLLFTSDFC